MYYLFIQLRVIIDYLNKNKVKINNINYGDVKTYINNHFMTCYDADACLILLNLINHVIDVPIEITMKAANLFKKLSQSDIYRIDMSSDMLIRFLSNTNLKLSYHHIANYLVRHFDDENILNYIESLCNKFNIYQQLTENVQAYYYFHTFMPSGLDVSRVKSHYHQIRKDINSFSKEKITFYYTLFKYNGMQDYCADLLSINNNDNNFILGDFILNSKLTDTTYTNEISKVYQSIKNDKNNASSVHKTLALMKDNNINGAIVSFLENIHNRSKLVKENDNEFKNLLNQTFQIKKDDDDEKEFYFTLEKAKLSERIKNNIEKVMGIINHENKNLLKSNHIFMSYVLNKFTSNDKGSLTDELLLEIESDLMKLSKLSYETIEIPKELTDVSKIIDKLKVMIYLNPEMKSTIITCFPGINKLEYIHNYKIDEHSKKEYYARIEKSRDNQNAVLCNLLRSYVDSIKSESKKIVLDETTIRNAPNELLRGFNNIEEYTKKFKEHHAKLMNKYTKISKVDKRLQSLKYVEEKLELEASDLLSDQNKAKFYRSLLDKIKTIAVETKPTRFNMFRNINTYFYPNSFNKEFEKYIINNSHKYENHFHTHIRKRLLFTLTHNPHKIRGNLRNRSVILSAMKKHNTSITNYIRQNIKPHTNYILENIYNKLNKIDLKLNDNHANTEEIFQKLLNKFNININKSYTQAKNENFESLKVLLDQDIKVLNLNLAVYMIIFGVENNLPYGKII
jgi:hypothetical protein